MSERGTGLGVGPIVRTLLTGLPELALVSVTRGGVGDSGSVVLGAVGDLGADITDMRPVGFQP